MSRADLVLPISRAIASRCDKCGRSPAVEVPDQPIKLCEECFDDLEAMMAGMKIAGALSGLGRVRIRMQDGSLYEPRRKR